MARVGPYRRQLLPSAAVWLVCGMSRILARISSEGLLMVAPSIVEAAVVEDIGSSAVSWPAILAGGAAAAAISMILLAFGAGVGFSAISPWSSSAAMTVFHVSSGLYFIVMAMIASSIGGYLAGRLRTRWRGAHTREVFFR